MVFFVDLLYDQCLFLHLVVLEVVFARVLQQLLFQQVGAHFFVDRGTETLRGDIAFVASRQKDFADNHSAKLSSLALGVYCLVQLRPLVFKFSFGSHNFLQFLNLIFLVEQRHSEA